jgi:hypothetical protein
VKETNEQMMRLRRYERPREEPANLPPVAEEVIP